MRASSGNRFGSRRRAAVSARAPSATAAGAGDMAPTGGRSMAAAAAASGVGVTPHRSANDGSVPWREAGTEGATAAVTPAAAVGASAAFDGCGAGLAPLARTRIAAPSKVTSTVPSRSVR
jgi:hypothetical protein